MAVAPDHYAVLGISPLADETVVRAAWRALCRKYHPDTSGGLPDADEKFRAVNDAYAVLNDPNRRIGYDLERTARPAIDPPFDDAPIRWVESPYPMPPTRTGAMTLALIVAFVALPVFAISLPGVPGQVAAMLPRDGTGITGLARSSFGQVRRLLSPSGFGANAAPRAPTGQPLPTSAIDARNVALARMQYGRVIGRHGQAGVPIYAQACAERAKAFATWESLDFCVAFDIRAGRLNDAAMTARYARLGADAAAAGQRIAAIRALVTK